MIAVIFEVEPNEGFDHEYFERAANLRPLLEKMDGFISVERFRSLANENRYLSLSFWRDEASVAAWRQTEEHRAAQSAGRTEVFADYRLRIAAVVRDYGLRARDEAPFDARVYHHA
ncbi:antibiotic biosynthesis monooxygenase family protein [Phyllobacterium myrsinacearum]|uniref:Heme-degrading monooxygenase HmoA n=1 Tax=Phyllobacterium myrsinacearum TaxID=28101 RepID=A0A839EC79_9HYPH|nr:antibiotic biosynthesis monooxygenase [Phyllobacterium myrsinacearum]MBA8877573.1 heme-degrading monooxygenase HmoA [Phyllobacterium myrsinacearum]